MTKPIKNTFSSGIHCLFAVVVNGKQRLKWLPELTFEPQMDSCLVGYFPRQLGRGCDELLLDFIIALNVEVGRIKVGNIDISSRSRHAVPVQMIPDRIPNCTGTDAPLRQVKLSNDAKGVHQPVRTSQNPVQLLVVTFT